MENQDDVADIGPAKVAAAHGAAARVTTKRRGVYVASRASVPERGAMWRRLRAEGWLINSSWIDEDGEGQTADFGELWIRIEAEIKRSTGLVFYAEPDDLPLKGAYIEVGMALSAGLPVCAVLPDITLDPRSYRPIGSWLRHPLVRIVRTVEVAFSNLGVRSVLPPQPPVAAAPAPAGPR